MPNNQIKKIMILAAAATIALMCFISGCTAEKPDKALSDDPYCRENIEYYSKSASFGSGKSQDIDVALQYIYQSEAIAEKCGSDFQISGEQIKCVKSEGKTLFLSSICSGEAEYEINLYDDIWYRLTLSKTYFGKWKVDLCEEMSDNTM